MLDPDDLVERLQRSAFRRRSRLRDVERQYLPSKGLEVAPEHGAGFIEKRLAPAGPPNDGKQTPMRNHPVFVAQHATATCCRGCLEKWHAIQAYKLSSGRMFPTWSEVLEVLKGLGYEKSSSA